MIARESRRSAARGAARWGMMAGIAAFGVLAHKTAAYAEADLVINIKDSFVQAGSCETSSPLASGRIAIKNQGEDIAALGVTQRFARSMLAVYVPENIDMMDKRTEREKLDPFDQEGVEFEVGAGVVKKGRHFGPPSRVTLTRTQPLDTRDQNTAIQRALDRIGYDPGGIDGIIGSNTRSAIREFQESIGAARTGFLTTNQIDMLFQKSGVSVVSSSGATGLISVTLYAVVDPYNLINESNESNNIWAFEIEVDCS